MYPTHDTDWAESATSNYCWRETGMVLPVENMNTPSISKLLTVTSASLWQLVREVHFQAPQKLGPNTTAWRCADVRSYLMGNK